MMGRLEAGQERLFYHFRLEDQVPANHLLRKLDALLDLDMVRKQLEPFYSEIGRPSVDPELMIRMLLIGYCYSIRSERRLCDEVRFNLAYRWFCGLGLEAAVPPKADSESRGHLGAHSLGCNGRATTPAWLPTCVMTRSPRTVPQHFGQPQPLRLPPVQNLLHEVGRQASERQEPQASVTPAAPRGATLPLRSRCAPLAERPDEGIANRGGPALHELIAAG